jgi:hypothetical protein
MEAVFRLAKDIFGDRLCRQSTRMRVPVIATTGTGTFSTHMPLPRLTFLLMTLAYPILWRHLAYAAECRIEGGFYQETYIADASGHILDRVAAGSENYALADINLADAPPQPTSVQPNFGITPLPYLLDAAFNAASVPIYRRKVRAHFGPHMAPIRPETRRWTGALLAALVFGFVLGKLFSPRRVKVMTGAAPVATAHLTEPSQAVEVEHRHPVRNDRREVARLLLPLAIGIGRAWLDRRQKRKSKE